MKVSVFNSITKTDNPAYASIFTIADKIKTGGDQREYIASLREMPLEDYKKGKRKLPLILFTGEFNKRSIDGLIKHNGAMILDFDKVKDLDKLREEIESKPYTLMNFLSPSGDGFKTVIRIPTVKSDDEYKVFFKGVKAEFPDLDESGADISRACFFSHDPNIFVNKYATEFRLPDKSEKVHRVKDWDKVNKALRKIEDAVEGEKHIVRMKISHLMGGWVATKALTYADALDLLEQSVRKNTTDFPAAMKDVRDGLMSGMKKPLHLNEEGKILDMKVGLGKVYYHMDEVWEKVERFYHQGYQRGLDTGWESVDGLYSILMGTTTIIYAHPYSGKSQLWNEILVNLSVNYGLNHVLLSPESGEVEHTFGELISIHAGKSFEGEYKMTEEEFKRSSEFIKKHFFLMDTFGEDFNIRDFFNQVEAIERTYGIKIHTTTIDPLNYLDHVNENLRSDKAQDKDLDIFNSNARRENRHNCIITHVRDIPTRKEYDRETKEVIREWLPMPAPRDILNGQSFWRKGMNMFCTYRPLDLEGVPLKGYEHNETILAFSKIKPKGVGKRGQVSLHYDWKKNRYYELRGTKKVYAKGFTPQDDTPQKSRIATQGWGDTEIESPF